MKIVFFVAGLVVAALSGVALKAAAGPVTGLKNPTYSPAQAQRGQTIYMAQCQSCHGDQLYNGQFAAALKGPAFTARWGAGGLDAPFQVMITQMPPNDPGGLGSAAYADILAFILRENGIAPSDTELPGDQAALSTMAAPQ